MAEIYIYGDESGDFEFSSKGSRYFILTTVRLSDYAIGEDLLSLRRQLAWEGVDLHREFHATDDKQAVRDRVFDVVARHHFRIDSTILEKRKARPHVRQDEHRFYQTAWFYHMRHVVPRVSAQGDQLLVIAASIGTKAKRRAFSAGLRDVMDQVAVGRDFRMAFWPAAVDPCLQVADYCSWAIQRKWENQDTRSYDLIKDRIHSEYDLFRIGKTYYYE